MIIVNASLGAGGDFVGRLVQSLHTSMMFDVSDLGSCHGFINTSYHNNTVPYEKIEDLFLIDESHPTAGRCGNDYIDQIPFNEDPTNTSVLITQTDNVKRLATKFPNTKQIYIYLEDEEDYRNVIFSKYLNIYVEMAGVVGWESLASSWEKSLAFCVNIPAGTAASALTLEQFNHYAEVQRFDDFKPENNCAFLLSDIVSDNVLQISYKEVHAADSGVVAKIATFLNVSINAVATELHTLYATKHQTIDAYFANK
jgi:hypothetical protein